MKTLLRLADMHVHLREGEMLEHVLPYTTRTCAYALVMPNLKEPLCQVEQVLRYRDQVQALQNPAHQCQLLFSLYLGKATRPCDLVTAVQEGVRNVKLYPIGVTTNSTHGVIARDLQYPLAPWLTDLLTVMSATGMTLNIHGEIPGVPALERERNFMLTRFIPHALEDFPGLKIVLEHISQADSYKLISHYAQEFPGRIAATITLHHLHNVLDDVLGDELKPHEFCKPIYKTSRDRGILRLAAAIAASFIFLGSDSAPHSALCKSSHSCPAGCFTAPVLAEGLVHLFHDILSAAPSSLEYFAVRNACKFYGLPVPKQSIILSEREWQVPCATDSRHPVTWRAGTFLPYSLEE